jgi:hypothetical protein
MTQNTEINQQQNGFDRRKYAFWSGPVSLDLNPIEMQWHDLERFTPDFTRILLN